MRDRIRNASPEVFALYSAIVGIALAAVLSQTRILAFGSFQMMLVSFLVADIGLYAMMKLGLIKSPRDRRQP